MGYQPSMFERIVSFLDYHDQASLRGAVLAEKVVMRMLR